MSEVGLRTIDLFSGAGGLSEGFEQAGFEIAAAVDFDAIASETYRKNHPSTAALCADIAEVTGADLMSAGHLRQVDVVIGGPSCQGFSTHGRRNGWVRDDDPRNFLYKHFVRIVDELRPKWFVMENVPGLLYFEEGRFGKRVLGAFEKLGYQVEHRLLLAADYGIAQLRRRLFIIGTRTDGPFLWPIQTHMGAYRRDAVQLWARRLAENPHLAQHLTVWDAISDLPAIKAGGGKETSKYLSFPKTDLQETLRDRCVELYDHQAYPLPDVHLRLIRHVREGETWREIPASLLPERFKRIRRTDGTNLFARLDRQRPAYTVTTQFYNVTTGCYTHPTQNRPLSAREGARIQSFPDEYRFYGTLEQKYRQIGNSVPPLLARAVGESLKASMTGARASTAPAARTSSQPAQLVLV